MGKGRKTAPSLEVECLESWMVLDINSTLVITNIVFSGLEGVEFEVDFHQP